MTNTTRAPARPPLPADAIVVVPRLGSLAEPAAFVAEVETRLAAAGAAGKVERLAAPAPA